MQHAVINHGMHPIRVYRAEGAPLILEKGMAFCGVVTRMELAGPNPLAFTVRPAPKLGPLTPVDVANAREHRVWLRRSMMDRLLQCAAPVLTREEMQEVHDAIYAGVANAEPAFGGE